MRSALFMLPLLSMTAPALAQTADRPPSIQVVGTATVSTPPDVATLVYWITGEGKTADEASSVLATKQKAITGGLVALLGRETQLSSGEISVIETRSPQCDGPGNFNNRPRLSEGACAITGYIATLQGTGRTRAVSKAGTAAGLAARLGARDARVQGFVLGDPADAERRATSAAIADARARAQVMATSAGVRLGELISLNDQNSAYQSANDIGRFVALAAQPAPPAPPPVTIDVAPRLIETQARVFAQFAIGR